MKILQVHPIMKTLNGSERVVIELANRLVDDGHDVEICSLWIAPECKREINPRVKLAQVGYSFGKDGLLVTVAQYLFLPLAMLSVGKCNVIISHASGSILTSLIVRKLKGGELVYLCHEPPRFAYDLAGMTKGRLAFWQRLLFSAVLPLVKTVDSFCVKNATRVIAISRYNANRIAAIYRRGDISVACPGVDARRFHPGAHHGGEIRDRYNLRGSIVLICVGKLHPRKNLKLQLYALKQFLLANKDIYLMIVGDGPHKQQLKCLSHEVGVSDHVIFTGSVDEEELAKYYSAADVFIFTAYEEPFGLVVIEAMAAGLPVVAPDEGGPSETVIDGETGFLYKQGDIADLCGKIQYLIDHPQERKEIGEKARKRALEYSWGNYYEIIMKPLLIEG